MTIFIILLGTLIVICLGIGYSEQVNDIISTRHVRNPSVTPSFTKYSEPDQYYFDLNASQGVIKEGMENRLRDIKTGATAQTPTVPSTVPVETSVPLVRGEPGSVKGFVQTQQSASGNGLSNFFNKLKPIGSTGPNGVIAKGPFGGEVIMGPRRNFLAKGPRDNLFAGSVEPTIGGCASTQYGCCDDNLTSKNADGSNCPQPTPSPSSCSTSQYGCCDDNVTSKNADGSNCPQPVLSGCATTPYGCCDDNVTPQNQDSSNCLPILPMTCADTPYGCCDDNVTPQNKDNTNCPKPKPTDCSMTQYGCCPDNVTFRNVNGSNCPQPTCSTSQYGCCDDNVTFRNANGSNCPQPTCSTSQYGCCDDNVTFRNVNGSNCPKPTPSPTTCSTSQYGCCPDNITFRNVDGSNCNQINAVSVSGPNNTFFAVKGPQGNIFTGAIPNTNAGIGGCEGTQYGCCPDNVTSKNSDGSNCNSPMPSNPSDMNEGMSAYNTSTVFIPPPLGSEYNSGSSGGNSGGSSGGNSGGSSGGNSGGSYGGSSGSEPRPCPPCGRCPEPAFDCKKVPNYGSTNSEYLPTPVLSDFSQFGM